MVKRASCKRLSLAHSEQLEQTESRVDRVASDFDESGKGAKAKKCEAMAGLIKKAVERMALDAESELADSILIGLEQKKLEHFEIATYATLCTWTEQLPVINSINTTSQTGGFHQG